MERIRRGMTDLSLREGEKFNKPKRVIGTVGEWSDTSSFTSDSEKSKINIGTYRLYARSIVLG